MSQEKPNPYRLPRLALIVVLALGLSACTNYRVGLQQTGMNAFSVQSLGDTGYLWWKYRDVSTGNCTEGPNSDGCIETARNDSSSIRFELVSTSCDGGNGTLEIFAVELAEFEEIDNNFGGASPSFAGGINPIVARDFGADPATGEVQGIKRGDRVNIENKNNGNFDDNTDGYSTYYQVKAECSSNGAIVVFDPPIRNGGGKRNN